MLRTPKYPCGICHKNVNEKGIFCNNCNFWHHIKCNGISASEYEALSNESDDIPWYQLHKNISSIHFSFWCNVIKHYHETLSNLFGFDKPSVVDSLPSFEITPQLTNLPNLQDYDIDEHFLSHIDSSYQTIQDLSSFGTSPTDLSLLHMNIRSLSCHFDDLQFLRVNLNICFNVVGVSETWDSFARPLSTNEYIPGYTFLSSKSQSQNGGVGLYIKTGLGPIPRPDLVSESDEYETVWAEIENSKDKNILICCAYRHPSSEIEHFNEYIQRTLSNPSVANRHV